MVFLLLKSFFGEGAEKVTVTETISLQSLKHCQPFTEAC